MTSGCDDDGSFCGLGDVMSEANAIRVVEVKHPIYAFMALQPAKDVCKVRSKLRCFREVAKACPNRLIVRRINTDNIWSAFSRGDCQSRFTLGLV